MVYLNYRNEYIWPPTRKWLHNFETFHLASLQFITFDHFESIHLIFEIDAWNFWYFNLMNKFLAFRHHIFSIGEMLSLFLNQILVCAMAFAAHYLFSFWDLYLLSSLSKNNKRMGRDIGTNLRMNQNQHDYWLIIHDKLENRFTTITQGCQDFSQKDISAKRTS